MKNAIDFMTKIQEVNEFKEMIGEIKYSVLVWCNDIQIGNVNTIDGFIELIKSKFAKYEAVSILTSEVKSSAIRREFRIRFATEAETKGIVRLIVE
jgi:hypothetical protein